MKKLFCIVLSILLLLSLAGCPANDAQQTDPTENPTLGSTETTPSTGTTTVPTTIPDEPETVELVTAYECGGGSLLGIYAEKYRMEFAYADDYKSGTVKLTINDVTADGTFTCDENYNINKIEVQEDGATILLECTFDDAHRLTSAKSTVLEDGKEPDVRHESANRYDEAGRSVYTKQVVPGEMASITETQYNDQGKILRQTMTTEVYMEGNAGYTAIVSYEYDENGYTTGVTATDGNGTQTIALAVTHEVKGDEVHYTYSLQGIKMMAVVEKNGKVIRQETYNGDTVVSVVEIRYDDQGRLIHQTQTTSQPNYSFTSTSTYTYSQSGRLIERTQTRSDDSVPVYQRTEFTIVTLPEA